MKICKIETITANIVKRRNPDICSYRQVNHKKMGNKPVVLVVDNDPANFSLIEILLFREGYEFHYQDSGKGAIASLDHIQPDLILLDVIMPETDGLEVCQQIKSNQRWQHIPIIIVTSLSEKEDLVCCLDAGADDFVGKPINGNELRARMRSMLRIKAQYDHIQATMMSRQEIMQAIVQDLRDPLIEISLECDALKALEIPDHAQTSIDQISKSIAQMRLLVDDISKQK
jgi:DNA-binding response OmpR family regulator